MKLNFFDTVLPQDRQAILVINKHGRAIFTGIWNSQGKCIDDAEFPTDLWICIHEKHRWIDTDLSSFISE